jgi:hypothetical protein
VSLFVSVVFGDVMEVVSSDDDGSLHLGADDDSLQYFSTDGDTTGERALLIDVGAFNSFLRCFEVKSDVFVVPDTGMGLLCD